MVTKLDVGRSYRLVRDYEIHDEKTGTLKYLIRSGEVVKVRKIDEENDHVYFEGVPVPAFYQAFLMHVTPVDA